MDEALAVFELLEQFAVKHTTAIDEGNIKWVEDGLYYVPFIAFSKGWGIFRCFFFSFFSPPKTRSISLSPVPRS